MILETIIMITLCGICWAIDKRFDHLEDYINERISSLEAEIICKK